MLAIGAVGHGQRSDWESSTLELSWSFSVSDRLLASLREEYDHLQLSAAQSYN